MNKTGTYTCMLVYSVGIPDLTHTIAILITNELDRYLHMRSHVGIGILATITSAAVWMANKYGRQSCAFHWNSETQSHP